MVMWINMGKVSQSLRAVIEQNVRRMVKGYNGRLWLVRQVIHKQSTTKMPFGILLNSESWTLEDIERNYLTLHFFLGWGQR